MNRIDKDTSGLVLAAKNGYAAPRLACDSVTMGSVSNILARAEADVYKRQVQELGLYMAGARKQGKE